MDDETNLADLEPLLDMLYNHGDGTHHSFKDAEQRLRRFQMSHEAWSLGLEMIQTDRSARHQFFGAVTLLHKLSYQWDTIESSSETLECLFAGLIKSLAVTASGLAFVRAKCIQVLATFLVRAFPALSHCDERPLERLISTLHSCPIGLEVCEAMILELFGSLAEQLQRLDVPLNDRPAIVSCIHYNLPRILSTVSSLMSQHPLQALEAARQWMQYGIPVGDLKNLSDCVTLLLGKDEFFEASLETLATLISDQNVRRHQSSFFTVLLSTIVGPIRQHLLVYLQVSDFDSALAICRYLSDFGDAFVDQIVRHMDNSNVRIFLELMLTCLSTPGYVPVDQELGEVSLCFWISLEEALSEAEHSHDTFVFEISRRALHHILASLRHPPQFFWEKWTQEVQERYASYRIECYDTIKYCYFVVGNATFLEMADPLQTFVVKRDYDGLEANLYALTSLAEYWRTAWSNSLKGIVVDILPAVSESQHLRLAKTSLHVLDAFSHPIHDLEMQIFSHIIDFILKILFSFTQSCVLNVGLKALDNLLQARSLSPEVTSCTFEAILMLSRKVNFDYLHRIVEILFTLTYNLPKPSQDSERHKLFTMIIGNLQKDQDQEKIHSGLNCAKSFLQELRKEADNVSDALSSTIVDSCSILENLCPRLSGDEIHLGIISEIFVDICQIVNVVGLNLTVSKLLQRMFLEHRHVKCFESLASISASCFIKDEDGNPMFVFLETALVCMDSPGTVADHPDAVEIVWNMLHSVFNTVPLPFTRLDSDILSRTFTTLYLWSFRTPEKLALHALYNLTKALLRLDPATPLGSFWAIYMDNYGSAILTRLLQGIGGTTMPSLLPKIAEVMLQFAHSYPNIFRSRMEQLLFGEEDIFLGRVTIEEKRMFLKTLLGCRRMKRYKEAIKTFSMKCRGLEGTDFGRASFFTTY